METSFNTELKRIRKLKGLTQEQLAEKVGVSAQAVSKWEISSYPDPQLLPQIADVLDVTIDELYGRGKEEKSLNQTVLDEIRKRIDYNEDGVNAHNGCFDMMIELCRAFYMGTCGVVEYRPIEENIWNADNWETFSQSTFECGFHQSRLPENLHYFLLMPEPKDGYDKILAYDEKMVEMFRFLGSPDALRAMYFLAGRKNTMFFNEKTIACELGISEESGREIIDGMLKFKFVREAYFNNGRSGEKICQYLADCNFVSFITFAHILLNRPYSFNYQTGNRETPYFKNDTYKKVKDNGKKE